MTPNVKGGAEALAAVERHRIEDNILDPMTVLFLAGAFTGAALILVGHFKHLPKIKRIGFYTLAGSAGTELLSFAVAVIAGKCVEKRVLAAEKAKDAQASVTKGGNADGED